MLSLPHFFWNLTVRDLQLLTFHYLLKCRLAQCCQSMGGYKSCGRSLGTWHKGQIIHYQQWKSTTTLKSWNNMNNEIPSMLMILATNTVLPILSNVYAYNWTLSHKKVYTYLLLGLRIKRELAFGIGLIFSGMWSSDIRRGRAVEGVWDSSSSSSSSSMSSSSASSSTAASPSVTTQTWPSALQEIEWLDSSRMLQWQSWVP